MKTNVNSEEKEISAEIIPFGVPKTAGDGSKTADWLRTLPPNCFFLAKGKATNTNAAFFDRWGIAAVIPEAIMLAAPHRNNPLAYEFFWVDSQKFSEQNRFVALLPDAEAGDKDG